MLTTNNHTVIAATAATISQNIDPDGKALVLLGLVISHFILDAIPHGHYYDFSKLRKTWPGAIFEVGIGLFILPIIVWHFTQINLLWLSACVISASLFDFGVGIGIPQIARLNHWAHWWNGRLTELSKWIWEISETIILILLLLLVLK